ncbi:MAG: hydroxyacylglutathione hydrolase [Gammaproteobacteria bacterium]|nr:hydroxyacylglutathione hydrolase [Gammaproteobacteria bacterium]
MLAIEPIRAFDDNYIWLLRQPGATACAVVDPGDEDPVLERLAADRLFLAAILVTHKHGDHVGGVAALKGRFPDAVVYGPAGEPIPRRDVAVRDGDLVDVAALGARFAVLGVPGHTEDHVAYLTDGALFCGDTLFAAGCGRVFSGTFEQLHASLQRLAILPEETAVYCAHEYTEANLGFAEWVEPSSAAIQARLAEVRALRERDAPTVPSRIGIERATNPFLRVAEPAVVAAAERWAGHRLGDGARVFRALRTWKDRDYD